MKTLLLYGGGIDSSALLAYLAAHRAKGDLGAVFFRYGQKAETLEHAACLRFCNYYDVSLTVIDVPFVAQLTSSAIMRGGQLANDPSVNIVDGRNLTFIALAGMYAAKIGATELAMGYHVEPVARPFPDASIEFVHAVNAMIPFAFKRHFEVIAPFKDWEREDIFRWAKANAPAVLQHAHTCYEDVPGGCGECSHCKLKAELLTRI